MKTKITNISPDQNIIEHESGLRTVFVETNEISGNCEQCAYSEIKKCLFSGRPCDPNSREDKKWGYFKTPRTMKPTEQHPTKNSLERFIYFLCGVSLVLTTWIILL